MAAPVSLKAEAVSYDTGHDKVFIVQFEYSQ